MTTERFTPLPAPGGWVCSTCGIPVEDEPCAEHNRMNRRYGVHIIEDSSGQPVDETAWDDDGQPFTHETAQTQAAFARLHGYQATVVSEATA